MKGRAQACSPLAWGAAHYLLCIDHERCIIVLACEGTVDSIGNSRDPKKMYFCDSLPA